MFENSIIPLMYDFERFGIKSHNPQGNGIGLWKNEMECLLWCALNSPAGSWIEIGSWNGGSTTLLCLAHQWLKLTTKIYTIDIKYDGWFDDNMSNGGFWNRISKINGTSNTFKKSYPDKPISFAFIDGFHSFKWIIQDFENILSNLVDGAIICFHDCSPAIYNTKNLPYIEACYEFAQSNYEKLMKTDKQDFLVDEAIAYIIKKYAFKSLDIPVRQYEFYPRETGLNKWMRGTTSPYNGIMAVQK